ncbi:MAG: hypothetical protein II695_08315 [Oscillospiraceae bacterium]|nr:hypothetical protein [Oscillospiraceae bacterium]
MDIRIENDKIIFTVDGTAYFFDAHGEYPRPSVMPSVIVGGKHLSGRSTDEKLERYIAVQDAVIGNSMAAWYTQEFVPDGIDYKLSRKSAIYIGDFATGEERMIYKGECYGDLCFDGNCLYFNTGNKVAVYDLSADTVTILFKHSGIKKSDISLHITPKRIFFQHWTHSSNKTMWYDRETEEVIDPHFDGRPCFFPDDDTIIYDGIEHAWVYDVSAMKKKRFFSNKKEDCIFRTLAEFFGVPEKYCGRYHSMFARISLENYGNGRAFFKCDCSYDNGLDFEDNLRECHALGLPMSLHAFISCTMTSDEIHIEADKADIIRKEEPFTQHFKDLFDFPDISLWTYTV